MTPQLPMNLLMGDAGDDPFELFLNGMVARVQLRAVFGLDFDFGVRCKNMLLIIPASLPTNNQQHDGGYVIGRTHINSCDFSVGSYSFDDKDGDADRQNKWSCRPGLKHVSRVIEMIRAHPNRLVIVERKFTNVRVCETGNSLLGLYRPGANHMFSNTVLWSV